MPKIKIYQLTILIVLITGQLSFSQIKIGAKVGYSMGSLVDGSDNIYTDGFESVSGIDAGLLAEFSISELFSIQTELNYVSRGGERIGFQPVPVEPLDQLLKDNGFSISLLNSLLKQYGMDEITDENPLYANYGNESKLKYLELPILAKFGWGTDWRFYVNGGIFFGFLLNAEQITSGSSTFYLDSKGDEIFKIPNPLYDPENPGGQPQFVVVPEQSFDANTEATDALFRYTGGVQAGAGVIKRIYEQHEVFFDMRASYSFIPLHFDETFGKSKVGGIIFSFGYAYTLPKK